MARDCGLIVGCWLAGIMAVAAAGQELAATVSIAPPAERTLGDYGGHVGHRFRQQTARFSFGKQPYAIVYQACVDPAHGDQVSPLEGYIGMPEPCSTGWYHGGFLSIGVNGQDVGSTPLSSMMVTESGPRAIVDMVWHHPLASVRARFVGLPGQDGLLCEIALEPKAEITSITVGCRCYPSFFTAWNHRDGARRIQTPGTLIEQGTAVTVPAAENWWAIHYDEVFDVAKGEGDGPCAMMALPQEATDIHFAPQSYQVDTRISYPADVRRLHLAFWKFPGSSNAEVLARFPEQAPVVRETLETTDFRPAAVRDLDVAALRAEVEHATQSEAVKAYLGERLTEVRGWLEESGPALEPQPAAPSIGAEEKLLRSVDRYYGFMWEVKLAELLGAL